MVLRLKYHRGDQGTMLQYPTTMLAGPIAQRLVRPEQIAWGTTTNSDGRQKLTVTPRPVVAHESNAPNAGLVESPNLPLRKSSQPAAFVESVIGFSSGSTGVVGRSTRWLASDALIKSSAGKCASGSAGVSLWKNQH